jgi:tripartite-type tricarboxylate transporter receptor subunit TctC
VLELNRAGDLRVLAVTGPDRLSVDRNFPRPSKPCLVMVSLNSVGVFAPAGTAKEIVDRTIVRPATPCPTRNGSSN